MTAEVHEFGGERVEDVTFDDVKLGRGGYPTSPGQEPPPPPPAAVVPADAGLPPGVRARTDLEALLAEAHRDVGLLPIELPIPQRPGWSVRYRLLLDNRELQPWRRKAYDPSTLEGVDLTVLASLGLGALCVGLVHDGEPAADAGRPVTFADPALQQALGVDSPQDACRAWYLLDAHMIASWMAVLRASGHQDVISPVEKPGPT